MGDPITKTEKVCKSQKGKWITTKHDVFTCKNANFHATVETNEEGNVVRVYVLLNSVSLYNKELGKHIKSSNNIRSIKTGANNTLINDFLKENEWVLTFMSFGNNGNYSIHLYDLKEMLKK